jgi:hypothetical protein
MEIVECAERGGRFRWINLSLTFCSIKQLGTEIKVGDTTVSGSLVLDPEGPAVSPPKPTTGPRIQPFQSKSLAHNQFPSNPFPPWSIILWNGRLSSFPTIILAAFCFRIRATVRESKAAVTLGANSCVYWSHEFVRFRANYQTYETQWEWSHCFRRVLTIPHESVRPSTSLKTVWFFIRFAATVSMYYGLRSFNSMCVTNKEPLGQTPSQPWCQTKHYLKCCCLKINSLLL